ncbi:hypothetical protein PR001_g22851 [Phytophthora rubi]|nr:hypothetical protein PR001_g22851 [Phytophthora rubi]
MSSAAIGAGGGVASGSTVAVLQGIGSTAAVPLGIAAATVAVPAAIGVGVGAIFSGLHKDKLDSTSAYEQRGTEGNCWVVAIEKGPGNVRVLRYSNESDARKRFRESWSIRILYSPDGKEVAAGGWNRWAHATIRRVMKNEYFSV